MDRQSSIKPPAVTVEKKTQHIQLYSISMGFSIAVVILHINSATLASKSLANLKLHFQ